MRQPCDRNCPGRSATCHAECAKYAAYYAQQREACRLRLLEAEVKGAICDRQLKKKTFKMSL